MGGESCEDLPGGMHLKVLGAAALTGAAEFDASRPASAARELTYQPEKGGNTEAAALEAIRTGDEDQWMANTRKSFEVTGVAVQVESVGPGEVAPKAALAANVGAGPDIIYGAYDAHSTLSRKVLGPYRAGAVPRRRIWRLVFHLREMFITNGRWIAVGMAFLTESSCTARVWSRRLDLPRSRRTFRFLKLCKALGERTPGGTCVRQCWRRCNTWCHWLIWAHGGRMVNERNEVVINSKETLAALEYGRELYPTFIPGSCGGLIRTTTRPSSPAKSA